MTWELSPQRQQVASLITEGHVNKVIAHKLGIHEGTVKSHIAAILEQIGGQRRIHIALHYFATCSDERREELLAPYRKDQS